MEIQSLLLGAVREVWNEWELHGLILLSLLLQVFLFFFASMRRRSSWWVLRTALWLAYLLADSVAIYVLGHLAVRAREPGHELVSFWAPFVLIHLGGQDTITAFSKQDNELWLRHLLDLVTQVVVAGYVVAKASWPDARLRFAVVLVFLCGSLKYIERVTMLYASDPVVRLRMWAKYALSKGLQHRRGRRGLWTVEMTRVEAQISMNDTLDLMFTGRSQQSSSTGRRSSLQQASRQLYWDAVTLLPDIFAVDSPLNQAQNIIVAELDLPDKLQEFLNQQDHHNNAYKYVAQILENCYRRLYTKEPIRQNLGLSYLRIFLLITTLFPCVSTILALVLFMAADKKDQLLHANRVDVMVTYILLVGAIVLDVFTVTIFILSHLSFFLPSPILVLANRIKLACFNKQWSEELGQYNIINTAGMRPIGQLLDLDVTRTPVTKDGHMSSSVKKFILDGLLSSGTRRTWHIASTRGQLALDNWIHQHPAHSATATLKLAYEAVRSGDFPTGVLIWHIATEIILSYRGANNSEQQECHIFHKKVMSRDISNYVMYLVFKRGVMLTTRSQLVHDNARAEIFKVLSQPTWVNPRRKDAAMKLFERGDFQIEHQGLEEIQIDHEESASNDHMKKLKQSTRSLKSPVLPRAYALADELISINDEANCWDLIAAVWAEILYYTAPRCGGGFHYEHLSKGGEFISHVLLLMYYLGPFLPPPDA